MRVYRCYAPADLTPGATVELDESEAHHLVGVRRARGGDAVDIFNGLGTEARGLLHVQGRRASVEVERVLRLEDAPPMLAVACALTKSGDYEEMIQRGVELGMTRFQPLLTERTVVGLEDKRADKKREKWGKLAIEAMKQCERLWLPEVAPVALLQDAWREAQEAGAFAVLLRERAPGAPPLRKLQDVGLLNGRPVVLFVGPEGGWSPTELKAAEEFGVQEASLGATAILRTETAVLAALAVLNY